MMLLLRGKIKRFVHISTTEVYGDVTGEINEEFTFRQTKSEYNQSKIEAEKTCWQYFEKGLPLTVLRPSIVYGPFSMNWSTRIARMLIEQTLGNYEKIGEGKCNLIYIDDLVEAILCSLSNGHSVGHAFNIVGQDVPTWNEYFDRFNNSMGLPPLKKMNMSQTQRQNALTEPLRILGNFVRNHFMNQAKGLSEIFDIAKVLMKNAENKLKTTPSSDDFRLFSKGAFYTPKKSRNILNFQPNVPLDEGLKRTTEWLSNQGLLIRSVKSTLN